MNDSAASLLGASSGRLVGLAVTELAIEPGSLDGLLDAVNRDEAGTHETTVAVIHSATGHRVMEVTAVGLSSSPSAVLHFEVANRRRPARRPPRRSDGG